MSSGMLQTYTFDSFQTEHPVCRCRKMRGYKALFLAFLVILSCVCHKKYIALGIMVSYLENGNFTRFKDRMASFMVITNSNTFQTSIKFLL